MTVEEKNEILDLLKTYLPAHIAVQIGGSLGGPVFDSIVETMFLYGQNKSMETVQSNMNIVLEQSEKLGEALSGLRKIANISITCKLDYKEMADETLKKVERIN